MEKPVNSLRILFADDESHLREFMGIELPRMGHEVTVCPDGTAALRALEKSIFDVAILDMKMPGFTGIEVLGKIKQTSPETQVVILTGHATIDTAVQALRLGAFDYLTKPCKFAELEAILDRLAERRMLANKATALETRLKAAEGSPVLIGRTPAMQHVLQLIETVAPTEATVLILGETGTGKELVARSLHEQSERAQGPFIPVNCGALPENLVESELFGHRKGAFTGAETNRKGLFEVASGGTLFLDEMGELNKSVQVKLLRFLESGEIRRVGENDPFRVDVRVLCATHRDLREMIAQGDFREDLFFRINTFEIHLPPLRDRIDDIPYLAENLLARHAKRRAGGPPQITPAALEALRNHDWPGNVRELANVLERAMILAGPHPISPEHLPGPPLARRPAASLASPLAIPAMSTAAPSSAAHSGIPAPHFPMFEGSLRDVEMRYIQLMLERHNGNKPAAARELGISLKTLYNKINQLQQSEP
jgi:DNA-binding NtrC family response regulator